MGHRLGRWRENAIRAFRLTLGFLFPLLLTVFNILALNQHPFPSSSLVPKEVAQSMLPLKVMSGPVRHLKHILVVDDEPFVADSVRFLLEDEGYVIDQATSGYEALGLFEPGKFDMVFTDYLMPEMRGDKLAAAIKSLCPTQPVVMITAFPEKLTSSDCPLGGVDSFICKPFDANTLRTALARYVK
jgi:CheY-like chemotaxis protein